MVVVVAVPGADLLAARAGVAACGAGRVARCDLGTLGPGRRASVRLRFRPRRPGTVRPVVKVRADGIAARRLAVGPLRVRPGPARLSVRVRPRALVAARGQLIRYRLSVTAAVGGVAARGVRLCADPDAGARVRAAGSGRACWRLGTIAPGRTVVRTTLARVDAGSGAVRIVARTTASNVAAARSQAAVARLRLLPALPVTG